MTNKYQFMSDHELKDLITDNKQLMLSNFLSFDRRREFELNVKKYDAELKRRHQMMQDYKQKNTRTVNAFQNDMSVMGPNIVIKTKNRSQHSSKPKPSRSRTTPNMKNSVLNNDRKVNSPATTNSRDFLSKRRPHTPPKQPLAKSRARHASSYNLVDEDDDKVEEHMFWKPPVEKLSGRNLVDEDDDKVEEHMFWKPPVEKLSGRNLVDEDDDKVEEHMFWKPPVEKLSGRNLVDEDDDKVEEHMFWKPPVEKLSGRNLVDEDDDKVEEHMLWKPPVEKLSGSMEAVIVYPSRDDKDSVEVNCKDMECLEPGKWLSSTIVSFYMRYLRQQLISFLENMIRNCHFFDTFFYPKLEKKYKGDSFLKFRRWWKTVNLFEMAYLFIPVNLSSHWSLAIICIPNEEDKTGPVILHMDSLRVHGSRSIFDNIRSFLEEEWSYLQMKSGKITDGICENLDDKIIEKTVNVPQQENGDDCGLFILLYIEHFLKEAPERLREKDLSMFSEMWFSAEEASNLRRKIKNILVGEFKLSKDKETAALAPEN